MKKKRLKSETCLLLVAIDSKKILLGRKDGFDCLPSGTYQRHLHSNRAKRMRQIVEEEVFPGSTLGSNIQQCRDLILEGERTGVLKASITHIKSSPVFESFGWFAYEEVTDLHCSPEAWELVVRFRKSGLL